VQADNLNGRCSDQKSSAARTGAPRLRKEAQLTVVVRRLRVVPAAITHEKGFKASCNEMTTLTGGDLDRPIVAVGWNSERFDGRNLALRLVALGYKNVQWYRGGREAWEVAGLPEAEVPSHDLLQ
jgi:rhodanese-related sulfurtransferase